MEENKKKWIEIIQNKPNKETWEKFVVFCEKHSDEMNFEDSNDRKLLNYASTYLMKQKLGNFNAQDAIFMTKFLTKTCARQFGISNEVDVKILPQDVFEKEYGKDIYANNVYDKENNNSQVNYSAKLLMQLMSKDSKQIIMAMQTIGHEVTHAYQNTLIQGNGEKEAFDRTQYIMAMEEAAKATDDDFYSRNYTTLYKENQAEQQGLDFAISVLKTMKRDDILEKNGSFIQELQKACKTRIYDSKRQGDNLEISSISDTEMNARVSLHLVPELLEQYPILKIAFDKDGHKKDITTLLNERNQMLETRDRSEVDNLYSCILNETLIRGESKEVDAELIELPEEITGKTISEEQKALETYIKNGNKTDTFAKNLLITRLQRQGMNLQQIQNYMYSIEKGIDEVEQEKIRPEEETFRDGIGDKEEEEQGRKEDQIKDEETTWLETMQRFNERATEIEGYPKKQETVIQAISVAEKQRTEQEKGVKISNDGVR